MEKESVGEGTSGARTGHPSQHRRVLGALICGDAAFLFQQTAIIPALTQINRELHTSAQWSAWLLTGYLVITSVAGPLGGKLGDNYGRHRILVIMLAIFSFGAVGAALSPSIAALIIFRSVQGVGGSVFPLSIAIIRDFSTPETIAVNIGIVTAAFGLGGAIGYGSGGLITATIGWRYIFAAGAFVVMAAVVVVGRNVPEIAPEPQPSLDLPGGLLLALGFICILSALTLGTDLGWSSPWIGLILAAGFMSLAAYVWRETRTAHPLLDLSVLAQPVVALTNAASFLMGFAVFGVFLIVPYFAQGVPAIILRTHPQAAYGFGAGPIGMALLLICVSVGVIIGSIVSGVSARRIEPAWVLSTGMAIVTAGAVGMVFERSSPWAMGADLFALGLGYGLTLGSISMVITNAVDQRHTGAAMGITSVLRLVGGGIGGQIGTAILMAVTIGGTHVPSAAAFDVIFLMVTGVAAAGFLCSLGALPIFHPET